MFMLGSPSRSLCFVRARGRPAGHPPRPAPDVAAEPPRAFGPQRPFAVEQRLDCPPRSFRFIWRHGGSLSFSISLESTPPLKALAAYRSPAEQQLVRSPSLAGEDSL